MVVTLLILKEAGTGKPEREFAMVHREGRHGERHSPGFLGDGDGDSTLSCVSKFL